MMSIVDDTRRCPVCRDTECCGAGPSESDKCVLAMKDQVRRETLQLVQDRIHKADASMAEHFDRANMASREVERLKALLSAATCFVFGEYSALLVVPAEHNDGKECWRVRHGYFDVMPITPGAPIDLAREEAVDRARRLASEAAAKDAALLEEHLSFWHNADG